MKKLSDPLSHIDDFVRTKGHSVNLVPLNEDIEDITWPREDTKFLFECSNIFFNTRREHSVSPTDHVMFYLLYKPMKYQTILPK